ncbi:MAG: NUDIX hydrolase [Actinomycetota bacterium]|nr:NUDIX hydrolase [Actinomycetota bacterium]
MSDEFRITAVSSLMKSHVFAVERRTVEHRDRSFHRDVVTHPGAVAILARDVDGRIGVLRQYRAPFDRFTIEIPAGTLDVEAEEPLDAAKRELEEELGCVADSWRLLGRFMVSPGWSTQVMHIYEANDLTVRDRHPAGPEETASTIDWYSPEELRGVLFAEPAIDSTMAVALNLVYGQFFERR